MGRDCGADQAREATSALRMGGTFATRRYP